jgi:hypothetical protein
VNPENEVVRFVLPERTEREKAVSSRHFWTFLLTDYSLAIYRADSGLEILGLGPGIFIASAIRHAVAKRKVGKTLADAMPSNRRTFAFSRGTGPVKLRTTRRGLLAKRTVVVLTDIEGSVEIELSNKDIDTLKQHCPELEVVGD